MDFFVLPGELLKWIGDLLADTDYWILAWNTRPSIYSIVHRADDQILSKFAHENGGGEIQLFVGSIKLQRSPSWG
jgi:hypothetical protein